MIRLALEWKRPLDGTEIVFNENGCTKTGILMARSNRFSPVSLQVNDFEMPTCVAFLNAKDQNGLVKFADRFGVPSSGIPAEGDIPCSVALMPLLEALKDDLATLLFGSFDDVDHVTQMNKAISFASVNQRFDSVDGRHRLILNPQTFSDFLLFEAALARDTGAVARTCSHCNKVFLTGPMTGRRSTAQYCSDRCRVAAMRSRTNKKE